MPLQVKMSEVLTGQTTRLIPNCRIPLLSKTKLFKLTVIILKVAIIWYAQQQRPRYRHYASS